MGVDAGFCLAEQFYAREKRQLEVMAAMMGAKLAGG
jgi:hypothetical protein